MTNQYLRVIILIESFTDKQIMKTIGKNISELKKYNIDVLGNKYEVQREELRFNVSL